MEKHEAQILAYNAICDLKGRANTATMQYIDEHYKLTRHQLLEIRKLAEQILGLLNDIE